MQRTMISVNVPVVKTATISANVTIHVNGTHRSQRNDVIYEFEKAVEDCAKRLHDDGRLLPLPKDVE